MLTVHKLNSGQQSTQSWTYICRACTE